MTTRRAAVVGLGLIGGSVAMALRARGWHVTGHDVDGARTDRARELGAVDGTGHDPEAEITFVATPVGAIDEEVHAALHRLVPGEGRFVTDVGSVKRFAGAIGDPRFVGGHPLAGSEQVGLDGADPDLFVGATWALTPHIATGNDATSMVQSVVRSFGADVLHLTPENHDVLVAMVSHVPHLTAATLMDMAAETAETRQALLRLAAGGFRDMTRISAGDPGIWLDICAQNRDLIVDVLDSLRTRLDVIRALVFDEDRLGLAEMLERAAIARRNLPARATSVEGAGLAELRVPVADRPGTLAEITTIAGNAGVNVVDLEIVHSAEGEQGVVVLVVAERSGPVLREVLAKAGYRPALSVFDPAGGREPNR